MIDAHADVVFGAMHNGRVGVALLLAMTMSGPAAGQVEAPEAPWRPDELRSQVMLDSFATGSDLSNDVVVVANVASLHLEVVSTIFVDVEVPWVVSHRDDSLAGLTACGNWPGDACFEFPSGAYGGLGNPSLALRYGDVHDLLGWSVGAGAALPGGDTDDTAWRTALADAQIATFNHDAQRWRRDTIAPYLSWMLDGRVHPWVSLQVGGKVVRHLPTVPASEPGFIPPRFGGGSGPRHASVIQSRIGARFRHPVGLGAGLHAYTVYIVGDGGLVDSSGCGRNLGCVSVRRASSPVGSVGQAGPSVRLMFEPSVGYEGSSWFVRAALRARLRRDFATGDNASPPDFTGRLTFGTTIPMTH